MLSRLLIACRSSFPMIRRCGSVTRQSIGPSMSSRAADWNVSCLAACVRAVTCVSLAMQSRRVTWAHVTAATLLSKQPTEAEDRKISRHWEGDPIINLHHSELGTLVERTTRYTKLICLPPAGKVMGGPGPSRTGPRRLDMGAQSTRNANERTIDLMPSTL